MLIIQINASYKPAYIYGGPTMSVSKLSEELVKAGVNVQVLTTTANGLKELAVNTGETILVDGVPVRYFIRLSKDHSHFSPALLIGLYNELNKKDKPTNSQYSIPDNEHTVSNSQNQIIHIHAWWNMVSILSCIICLWKSKPVLLSPRGTLSNYTFNNRKSLLKNIFHQAIGKALLQRCHFHVTSEKEKADIIAIINPRSIIVIPNFVNLGSYKNSADFSPPTATSGSFKLIFLSRIEEKKGLDILFKALALLRISWHLTIAGTGEPDYILYLKSQVTAMNLANRITWIGHQDNEQKFIVLAGHDLMILPSYDENFANVVIESLSVGTAVLISSNVGLADYVTEKDLGWVTDNTPVNLAESINTAFIDTQKRKRIRLEASAQINTDFDEQFILKRYLELYRNIHTNA